MILPAHPDQQMTMLFFLALALTGFVMKAIVLLLPATCLPARRHTFWLLVSPNSMQRLRARPPLSAVVRHLMLLAAWLVCGLLLFQWIDSKWTLPPSLRAYLAAPLLYLMSALLHGFAAVIWLPSGFLLPQLHDRPWLAHSVAEFWGRRWNLWFSDWFRHVLFQRLRHHPWLSVWLVFGISGIIHEWVINVPLHYVTGVSAFGSMMLYFLIQAFGLWAERTLKLRGSYCFTWLIVLVPVPLVLNEGLLRIMHLW